MKPKNLKREISECINILTPEDKFKFKLVALAQSLVTILDLIGVALVGVIAALAVNGVRSQEPGDRVTWVLNVFKINNFSLQGQTAILGILAGLLLIGRTLFSMRISRRILYFLSMRSAALSSTLVSKLLRQPLLVIQENSTQSVIYSATTGVNAIVVGVLGNLANVASDVALCLILGIGLLIYQPVMALSAFCLFAGILISIYFRINSRSRSLVKLQTSLAIENAEIMVQIMDSYREAVVKNRRRFYSDEIANIRYRMAAMFAEQSWMPNVSKYIVEITVTFGTLIIAAFQFASQDATHAVGNITLFLAAGTRVAPALLRIQQNAIAVNGSIEAAKPTFALIEKLQNQPELEPASNEVFTEHFGFEPSITVNKLGFTYPGKNLPALDSVNLQIQPGQLVAIVGPSGAGKSTLTDLMLGILEPNVGSIEISGFSPIDAISKWPGSIGYVPQKISLSSGSVMSNISMGYDINLVDRSLVWEALEKAHLSELVRGLPDQLEENIGEHGSKLSGGQRQRLGIARALFTKPSLLILDEATSALDGETELQISNSIKNLHGSTTVILIAHRLSTVRNADLVVYLEKGEVKSVGTFDEVRQSIPNFDNQAKLMGL